MDIREALSEVIEESYIDIWLNAPNKRFDNKTPQQLIDEKNYEPLERMIYVLRSGQPC